MNDITIFIDESGTLPDPHDTVVVVAAVGTKSPQKIAAIIKTTSKRSKLRVPSGELKFYTAGDKTKRIFLEKVVQADFALFVLVVEKRGKIISDTPENYAVLCFLLLSHVLYFYSDVSEIVFDKHFSRENDLMAFNTLIRTLLQPKTSIRHVDSQKDKRVTVADMVAGATLAKESGKTGEFYAIIEEKVMLKRVKWAEAKRKMLEAIKKLA